MPKAKIIMAPPSPGRYIPTSIKNTGISQRKTLEEIIINLASTLGVKEIYKAHGARGYFYEVQGKGYWSYQSASNTILELSRRIQQELGPNKSSQPTPYRGG